MTRFDPREPRPSEARALSARSGHGARHRWGLVAGPLAFGLLLALVEAGDGANALGVEARNAAAVGAWMAIWWMTEAVPIAATSLLPLVLFPLLGVADIRATSAPYANPLIFLFLGGFLIALALENSQLHRRLALAIASRAGASPRRLISGFMLASAALSMWISNTATAMLMLPIGLSIIELARRAGRAAEARAGTRASEEESEQGDGRHFALGLLLGVAYACSLGGMATLVGTPTNALLAAYLQETYGLEIPFVRWMLVALPLSLLGLAVVHLVLTRIVYPLRLDHIPGGAEFLRAESQALGPPSRAEKRVALVFGLTAVLWMVRPLLDDLLPGLSDAGIAMAGALALFAWPLDWRRGRFVLDWQATRRLPWGVLLLFGGGLSLASAIHQSGLASWIGQHLGGLGHWPMPALVAATVLVVVFLTELTSNTATAATFLPVLAALAIGLGRDPLLLLIPATLAASCAFMLPVATPPNAIVYGSGAVTVPEMARAGLWLNLVFVVLVTLLASWLLPWALGIDPSSLPAWATPAPTPTPQP